MIFQLSNLKKSLALCWEMHHMSTRVYPVLHVHRIRACHPAFTSQPLRPWAFNSFNHLLAIMSPTLSNDPKPASTFLPSSPFQCFPLPLAYEPQLWVLDSSLPTCRSLPASLTPSSGDSCLRVPTAPAELLWRANASHHLTTLDLGSHRQRPNSPCLIFCYL